MSVRYIAVLSFFASFVTLGYGGVVKLRDCPSGDKLAPPNGNKLIVDYAFADMCEKDTCDCLVGESNVLNANVTINTNAKNLWISFHFETAIAGSRIALSPDQNMCSYVISGPCENIVTGTNVIFKHTLNMVNESTPYYGIGTIMVRDDTNTIIYCAQANFICKRKNLPGFGSLLGG